MLPTGIDNGMRYLAFYVSILDQAMGEFYMVQRYWAEVGHMKKQKDVRIMIFDGPPPHLPQAEQ